MKNIIITSILTFCLISTNGQGIIAPSWVKLDSVLNGGTSEAWGIDIDTNNDIFWATSNNTLNQGLDIVCHKYEYGGNEVWATPLTFGGPGTQQAYICNASDTALYIGGRNCPGLVTTCDMLLLKVSKNTGALIWSKTKNFSANGYDEIDGLEINSEGIFCGGWSQELNGSIYRNDIGLWKLDFNGETEWTNYLGANTTSEHQDGHFVVDADNIYAAGLWGGSGIANLYNGHSFLGKFNSSNGNLIDSTLFGYQSNAFNDIENALGMTSDGTYLYITGYTTPVNSSDWQIFVAKFDKDLNQIWYTDWGGSGTESARAIKVEDNTIYVAGLTESNELMSGGDRDAVLLTLDTDGNVLSYQTYGSTDKESFQDLAIKNQNIYLTGVIENEAGNKKSILIALEDLPNSVDINANLFENNFITYPNPANGKLKIEFLNKSHNGGFITVYDLLGKQLINHEFSNDDHISEIALTQNGVLFIKVSFPNYRITKKIINRH